MLDVFSRRVCGGGSVAASKLCIEQKLMLAHANLIYGRHICNGHAISFVLYVSGGNAVSRRRRRYEAAAIPSSAAPSHLLRSLAQQTPPDATTNVRQKQNTTDELTI